MRVPWALLLLLDEAVGGGARAGATATGPEELDSAMAVGATTGPDKVEGGATTGAASPSVTAALAGVGKGLDTVLLLSTVAGDNVLVAVSLTGGSVLPGGGVSVLVSPSASGHVPRVALAMETSHKSRKIRKGPTEPVPAHESIMASETKLVQSATKHTVVSFVVESRDSHEVHGTVL
jgi:hypothetical protein